MKIGLFGGTFNPIHFGHIRLARQLLQSAGLDEVWFMVTPQNPFKVNHELLWDRTRYRMVEMALQRYKHLIASDYEFRLPKPSPSGIGQLTSLPIMILWFTREKEVPMIWINCLLELKSSKQNVFPSAVQWYASVWPQANPSAD